MTDTDVPGDDPSGIVVSSGAAVPGQRPAPDNNGVAAAIARVTQEDLPTAERRHAVGQLAAALKGHGFRDVFRPKAAMAWLSDTLVDVAPRIPLRTVATLR